MVFVVAEIGVNWDGDFKILEEMVSKSKEFGCDAVKFQAYNEEIVKSHSEWKRLMKATILPTNIEQVNKITKKIGIEWFCTPMYPEAVNMLEPYVNRYKIRELDGRELLENKKTELFEKVLNTNKEILISSNKSPKLCEFYGNSNIKWLYCIPKYPCKLEEIDFSKLSDFDGYSNHHPHFIAPLMAVILGSNIVEVHITLDKSKKFVDNNVSFDFDELKILVDLIRKTEKIKK